MTSVSSLDRLGAWRATRFPWLRFIPLAAFLVWAAWAGSAASLASIGAAFAIAAALLAQFRLWDDLVDRERDRKAHPERVLARAESSAPFERCAWTLGAANAIALAWTGGVTALAGFLLLCAAAALWYRLHRGRGSLHALVLHLKYPAFVVLIAPPGAAPAAGAGLAYAALIGFELLHARSRRGAASRYLPFALAAIGLTLVTFGEMP